MRIAKWDNAKFILIYCVVLGHMAVAVETPSPFLKGIRLGIYLFHMPAFLFLSGLLSKRTVRERKVERILPYLSLYLFVKVFRFLVTWAMEGEPPSFKLLYEGNVAWFALVLFFCYLCTFAVRDWDPVWTLAGAVVLGVMVGYDNSLGQFLSLNRFFCFYPFFFLGYLCPEERLREITQRRGLRILSAAVLVGVFLVCILQVGELYPWLRFLQGMHTYKSMDMPAMGGWYRLLYYGLALLLVFCVLCVVPSRESVLSAWGRRSIQVYALHYPLVQVLCQSLSLQSVLLSLWPAHGNLLILPAALILTWLLSLPVWEPFFDRLMHPVRRGKTKPSQKSLRRSCRGRAGDGED